MSKVLEAWVEGNRKNDGDGLYCDSCGEDWISEFHTKKCAVGAAASREAQLRAFRAWLETRPNMNPMGDLIQAKKVLAEFDATFGPVDQ